MPFLIIVAPWAFSRGFGLLPHTGLLPWTGIVLLSLGITLQGVAMWQLGSFFTLRLAVQVDQALLTTGAYRWIRHPGYLSYLISILGIGLAMSSSGTLALDILVS